jgi:protocatechuate 3,4-dioxygenase beta subunit
VDAVVEVWHCDASGAYSGFTAGGAAIGDERFLQGAQVTDGDGVVRFVTIYPGWYPGRTTHVHCRVPVANREALTTQLYFDDAFTARVVEPRAPYAGTERDTHNDTDAIFDDRLLLHLTEQGDGVRGLVTLVVARA